MYVYIHTYWLNSQPSPFQSQLACFKTGQPHSLLLKDRNPLKNWTVRDTAKLIITYALIIQKSCLHDFFNTKDTMLFPSTVQAQT